MKNKETNSKIQAELKKEKFLKGKYDYGEQFFVDFKYSSEEQKRKVYDLFNKILLPAYGALSRRSETHESIIMPYFVNESNEFTTIDSGIYGGTIIPEDLLPLFIQRFVEADDMTVLVGDNEIDGKFNKAAFNEMLEQLDKTEINNEQPEFKGIQAELKKGQYFEHGTQYFVTFKYHSDEQKRQIFEVFENELIPTCGAYSSRGKEGKNIIMPYLVDINGQMSIYNTGIVGGTNIPEDLLESIIKRFVETDYIAVTIGDGSIKDEFDEELFNGLLSEIEQTDLLDELNRIEEEAEKNGVFNSTKGDGYSHIDGDVLEKSDGLIEGHTDTIDEIWNYSDKDEIYHISPDELEMAQPEELVSILSELLTRNKNKQQTLDSNIKQILISKIISAQQEGKSLDAQIKENKSKNRGE